MFRIHVAARNKAVFAFLWFSLGLFASSAANTQEGEVIEIDVVGGNSSNSLMFGLKFGEKDGDPDVAITLNTDANAYPSLNSFTFVRNTCGQSQTDVVAASTNASRLVIYAGGQGVGASICGGAGQAACPARPVGLSTSTEQVISVATSGASGTAPGVFTFTAGDDENTCGKFGRRGGRLSGVAESTIAGTTIRAIADTEFVRVNGGGLEAGDLLVLVSNPAMIVHVPKGDIGPTGGISNNAASGTEFANSRSVFSGYRRATPTGLAIVPGKTPNVLVTLSTGAIANFFYDGINWIQKPFDTGGLFPNPRGVGAGARDDKPYIVVSEQNRGRYIRVEVKEVSSGSLSGSLERSSLPREIVSPVGAPEGIAVNQEDPNVFVATRCFNPESDAPTGCNFGPGDLHFSQGFDGGLAGERVRFNVQYIPDPIVDRGLLRLPHACDDDDSCVAQDFFVPATCRGYDTTDADPGLGFGGVPQLVLIDIELLGDFSVTKGNFAQVTERVKDTLGAGRECTETGARVYYHPSKDLENIPLPNPEDGLGFRLFDVTVSCQNPSRGISELRSPVVFCVDPIYVARNEKRETTGVFEFRNEFVNPKIRVFIDAAKTALGELQGSSELYGPLKDRVVGLNNPDNRNSSEAELKDYFRTLSENADYVAEEALALKRSDLGNFFTETPGLSEDLYARLLRSFLGLAFYAKETGLLEKYYPPAEFCRPYNNYLGILYPELQDVECNCSSATNPDYLCAFE